MIRKLFNKIYIIMTGHFKNLSLRKMIANRQRFCKILSAVACSRGKGFAITSKLWHPETFHSKPKRFWRKKSKYLKIRKTINLAVLRGQCWCRGHILCAAALHFVLWRCVLCCGIVLCATAMLFVPWQCSLCCSNALCAMARKWCAMVLHSIILHVTARNNLPQCCMAFCAVIS